MPLRPHLIALTAALALAGCAGGLGSLFAPPEMQSFDLSGLADVPVAKRHTAAQLVVPEPVALRWLDGDRIAVRLPSGEINYIADVQWSDRLPRLVQTRLVESLDRTHYFRAVARPGLGLNPDYQLLVEIRNFEVSAGEPAEAHVVLALKQIPASTGRAQAEHVFEARAPVSAVEAKPATAALDAAFGSVLKDIARWSTGSR